MTKPFTSHATWAYVAGEAGARPSLNESTSGVETMVGVGVTATWNHATGTGTILAEKKEEGKGARRARALLAEAAPKFKEAEEVVKKIKDKFHLDLTPDEYAAWASHIDNSYPKNSDAVSKVDDIVNKILPKYVFSDAQREADHFGDSVKHHLRMGLCEFLGIKNYNKW